MISAGIDIGSTATKAIVFDGRIRGAAMELTGLKWLRFLRQGDKQ